MPTNSHHTLVAEYLAQLSKSLDLQVGDTVVYQHFVPLATFATSTDDYITYYDKHVCEVLVVEPTMVQLVPYSDPDVILTVPILTVTKVTLPEFTPSPYDRVLVRDDLGDQWEPHLLQCIDYSQYPITYTVCGGSGTEYESVRPWDARIINTISATKYGFEHPDIGTYWKITGAPDKSIIGSTISTIFADQLVDKPEGDTSRTYTGMVSEIWVVDGKGSYHDKELILDQQLLVVRELTTSEVTDRVWEPEGDKTQMYRIVAVRDSENYNLLDVVIEARPSKITIESDGFVRITMARFKKSIDSITFTGIKVSPIK